MLKDINVKTQQFTSSTLPATAAPIIMSDLADYTDNPFGEELTTQEKETLSLQVSQKMGWYIDLNLSGEKNTAMSLSLNNVVYFSSYTPPSLGVDSISCDLPNGQGWLYAVDLALGIKKYNWTKDDIPNVDEEIGGISEQVPDSPTIIITKKKNPDTGKEELVTQLCIGRICNDIDSPWQTKRTYLYVDENQQ
jgi:type IV pilus assembly protein PilY1